MTEQKMSYQERVAAEAYITFLLVNQYTDVYVSKHDPLIKNNARYAVAAQAEAIREAMMFVWDFCGTSHAFGAKHTDDYLLEHGYKPKTEEDGTGYDWRYEQIVTPTKKQTVYVAQTKDDKGTDNLLTGFVIDFTNTVILVSVSGHAISFPYSHVYVKSQKDATERTDKA